MNYQHDIISILENTKLQWLCFFLPYHFMVIYLTAGHFFFALEIVMAICRMSGDDTVHTGYNCHEKAGVQEKYRTMSWHSILCMIGPVQSPDTYLLRFRLRSWRCRLFHPFCIHSGREDSRSPSLWPILFSITSENKKRLFISKRLDLNDVQYHKISYLLIRTVCIW